MNIRTIYKSIAVLGVAAVWQPAAAETFDFGALEPDTIYEYSQGDEVSGYYTAESDGPVKIVFTGQEIPGYSDAAHTELNRNYQFSYGAAGERLHTYQMTAGEVLYLYSSSASTISSGTMMVAGKPETLNFLYSSPSTDPESPYYYGGSLSASTYYRLSLFFDQPVQATSATLRFPDGTYVSVPMTYSNSGVTVVFNEQLMEAYRNATVKEGDEVTVRVVGVRCVDYDDIRYNGNGRIDVAFTVAAKPAELTGSVNLPTTGMPRMLSYYLPGDAAGIIEMEFDGELTADPRTKATLTFGNPDDLEHSLYVEDLPAETEGNMIRLDLTGKRRRPKDMTPDVDEGSLQSQLTLTVSDVYSADGQRVYTGSLTNYTNFGYVYPVTTLEYVVAADFVPLRGTVLRSGTEMEIWILNGSKCMFDGVKTTFTANGVESALSIPLEELAVKPDPESNDDLLINFTLPDLGADHGCEVKVELLDALYADGLDHNPNVCAFYTWDDGTGVEAAEADVTGADVFLLTGVKVRENALPADLRTLPAGIYIYKGRKIAVR